MRERALIVMLESKAILEWARQTRRRIERQGQEAVIVRGETQALSILDEEGRDFSVAIFLGRIASCPERIINKCADLRLPIVGASD